MAQGKKSFTAYRNWIDTFEELSDEEAGKLVKHLFRYIDDQNPEPPDRLTKIAFMEIKNTLKRDLQKWEGKSEVNKANGSLGGRPRKPKETQNNRTVNLGLKNNPEKPVTVTVKDTVTDKVNVTVKDTVNVNEKKKEQILSKKAEGETAFNFWWDVYDKKTDRSKCLKKFLTLSIEEMRECYDHSKLYAKAQPEKQYRRNPITYLNNENWKEDEFTKPRATNRPGGLHSEETRNNLERLQERWAEM
jgi:hypothetical protein